jgi:hypothetical protein
MSIFLAAVVFFLFFKVLRNRAPLLMVENEGIFEFGMNGGYFVVISVD